MSSLVSTYEELLKKLLGECLTLYKERLVSLVVFGSVGRRTPRPDSDIDVLVVAEDLPKGRLPRVREFEKIEAGLSAAMDEAARKGVRAELSPIFKTPDEVKRGSLLFLDIIHAPSGMMWGRTSRKFHHRFESPVQAQIDRLAEISKWLRKEREFSFYGDIDFIPTEEYSRDDAMRAMEDARLVVDTAGQAIKR